MGFSIDKAKTIAIITIALLMTSIALVLMPTQPTAKAATSGLVGSVHNDAGVVGLPIFGPLPTGVVPDTTIDTLAYMSFTPNPVGVGQQILVNVWTTPGITRYFYRQGYTVTIQKPDGTTETIGPFISYMGDCTAWFEYVVDQAGTWKFKFAHAGTYIPKGTYYAQPGTFPQPNPNITTGTNVYWGPSETDWQELTVQQDQVLSWPSVPLPTDYWTRPIQRENREWWTIGGNYPWNGAHYYPSGRVLYSSNYRNTYGVTAPNTAHIVWRRMGADAGIIGGEEANQISLGSSGGSPSIIYLGRCYQTLTKIVNGVPTSVWECYDLRTGQVYWDNVLTGPTPTNILYETPVAPSSAYSAEQEASAGVTVYFVTISGSRLYKYNPTTGALQYNISLPSGPQGIVSGSSSSMVCCMYDNEWVYWVQGLNATGEGVYRLVKWSMRGSSTNFTSRIVSNISWPVAYLGFVCTGGTSRAVDFDAGLSGGGTMAWDMPQGYSGFQDRGASAYEVGYNISSYDLNTGQAYYVNMSSGNVSYTTMFEESTCVFDHGKLAFGSADRHWACFDGRTGKLLWISDLFSYPWGNWIAYSTSSYDLNETNGEIVCTTYDGVYAIDWNNGHILWHYSEPNIPWESPYYSHPFDSGVFLADGKVYAQNSEHSASQPATRGWKLYCLNATTGELLWKMTSPMTPGAVADGYLTASSPYDGYTYIFGKGKSATTVSASPKTIAKGTTVLIEGTVMDMSPGDQGSFFNPVAPLDSNTKAGTVPCVSAASMETQMEYLYMQHPIDGLYHNETLTGIPVMLTAIGSDGTVTDLGTVTSNGYYGTFALAWAPLKEDTYTIMATFAGDDSYGSSTAATAVSVGPAPAATATPTATPPEAAPDNTPLVYATLAIIVAIVIVGLLIILALRKRQ
jgi:outer membrane protein assembly factor BamB